MKHCKIGRHAPAFILLILSLGPNHGLGILNKMEEISPGHRLDTAVIYRDLKKLEQEKCICSEWLDSDAGPKKKVYHITESGTKELTNYKEDIEKVIVRLQAFIEVYSNL